MTITGMFGHFALTSFNRDIPSLPGILMSSRIIPMVARRRASSATSADLARITSKQSSSTRLQLSSTMLSSSTTRIFMSLHPTLQGHPNGEGGSFADLAGHLNSSSMPLHDSQGHGQT